MSCKRVRTKCGVCGSVDWLEWTDVPLIDYLWEHFCERCKRETEHHWELVPDGVLSVEDDELHGE